LGWIGIHKVLEKQMINWVSVPYQGRD
jgi:hypothetical protein